MRTIQLYSASSANGKCVLIMVINSPKDLIGKQIIFAFDGGEYELRSHPYEPCLYICQNGEIVKVIHNAFDAYDLPEILAAGGTVRSIDSKEFNKEAFCYVLVAALNDRRYEID